MIKLYLLLTACLISYCVFSQTSTNLIARNTGNSPALEKMVIILSKEDAYAYSGGDMKSGKKYAYSEVKELLAAQKSNDNLVVYIRPTGNSVYKNTVELLDEMIKDGIRKYSMADASKEEEEYVSHIR